MNRIAHFLSLLLIYIIGVPAEACAQKRGVLVDMSNHQRVAFAKIYTNTGSMITSDKEGIFTLPTNAQSVTVSHPRYMSRVLDKNDMRDTIELLPRSIDLNEVVITAKAPGMSFSTKLNPQNDPLLNVGRTPSGNDFLGWLKVFEKGYVSGKQRAKRRKAIENY